MLKRTPLFEAHQQMGGKLIEFGGWEMPVQYTGIVEEHLAVRAAAGLFDISHMGEVLISGPSALGFLNGLLTNDLARLEVGDGQYTLLTHEQGGVIDDLYAFRLGEESYMLIINASRIEPDVAWLRRHFERLAPTDGTELNDISEASAAVAVQGPRVAAFLEGFFPRGAIGGKMVHCITDLKKNQIANFNWGEPEASFWISRTGYTGEDGFEIVAPPSHVEDLWHALIAAGRPHGLKLAGLGARDTLRTEMGYPLYGHELDEATTPLEAGLGFFVALDKGPFLGREVLAAQKAGGVKKKLVAFKMTEKSAPPRPHYPLWSQGEGARRIGEAVSGTQSPSLNAGIGLGYVAPEFAKVGGLIEVEIRGRRAPAQIVKRPIYHPPSA